MNTHRILMGNLLESGYLQDQEAAVRLTLSWNIGTYIVRMVGVWDCLKILFNGRLFFLLVLAIRINIFYGLIWWCRTNIRSPSSDRIRAPPAKRPLLIHLRSIGKRRFSLRLFCFSRSGCRSGLGCTSKWPWCLVLLSFRTFWWMGCRDRCEAWNLIRTMARSPLIRVSWIGIFVGWQYWSCWRNSIFRYHTSIWVL